MNSAGGSAAPKQEQAGSKLSRKQEQAIASLLLEPTLEAAAKATGIGTVTLWRWMQNDDFRTAYMAAKRAAVSQAISRLQQVATTAVDTLEVVMKDGAAPPAARVSAAKIVLEMSLKAVELEELETRIVALEQQQAEGKSK